MKILYTAIIAILFGALIIAYSDVVVPTQPKNQIDYSLAIHNDTIWLYGRGRLVGRVVDTSWNSPLMKLILTDNE